MLALAQGHLRDVGHEVVGDAVGRFAQQAAFVRAHRVEVTQDGNAPTWVSRVQLAQRVFAHELGAAIGVGGGQCRCFGDGHTHRVAIHGG